MASRSSTIAASVSGTVRRPEGGWPRVAAPTSWVTGSRYLVVRTVGRAIRDRDPAAFAMLWGFAVASARREPRYGDPLVRDYLRRQQSVRYLPLRVFESLGRR